MMGKWFDLLLMLIWGHKGSFYLPLKGKRVTFGPVKIQIPGVKKSGVEK